MPIVPAGILILLAQVGCAPVDFSAVYRDQCIQVGELSRAGNHKDAVDLADRLEKKGTTCPAEVREVSSISRSKLDRANALMRKALEYKKEDKLLLARKNMQSALTVYPKYYWVKELLKNVEISIEKKVAALQDEARLLESKGEPEEALQKILEARALSPQLEELKPETARLQSEIKKAYKEDNTLGSPEKKQGPSQIDHFAEAKKVQPETNTSKYPGKQYEKGQDHGHDSRLDIIQQRLDAARKTEQNGELEEAAKHMLKVLDLSSSGDPLTQEVVEYARLLGMKFFSTGNFTMAQVLWQDALKLSPGNSELQKYLKEVKAGLDSLQKIKNEEGKQSHI